MKDTLLLLAALAGYGGFACLALAMPDYWLRAGGTLEDHAVRGRHLRLFGVPVLCMSAAACLWRDGAGFGLLLWTLMLSASAIAVALTLAWWPEYLGYVIRPTRRGMIQK